MSARTVSTAGAAGAGVCAAGPAGSAPEPADAAVDGAAEPPWDWDAGTCGCWLAGAGLGWDAYGHMPGDPMAPGEDPADHGTPLPTTLPPQQELTFGQHYSGSPFLGTVGTLPPGQGGFNPGGFMYMWHSHAEKELCNFDIFPGGLLTMALVIPGAGMGM